MRCAPLAVVVLALALPLPSWAERPLTLASHGLRFLGLEPAEEARFQQVAHDVLSEARGLRLGWSGPDVGASCGRDVHCHCRHAREHGADRAVYGNVGRIGELFTVELILLDARSCSVANSIFVSESHDPSSARARLGALVRKLITPLEQLSATVVKEERDVDTVPATVTVFTARQIRELGIRSLSELFRMVPGFEVVDANANDTVLHLGLYRTILHLVDGIPLSPALSNISYLGQDFQMSLHHLNRVEFVRGPGSVLYGANAFLGMVNLIPQQPTSTSPRFTAEATYGTMATTDISASVEQSHRGFLYYVGATFIASQNPQSGVANSTYSYLFDPEKPVWGNAGTTDQETDFYYDLVMRLQVLRRLQLLVTHVQYWDHFQISPFGSLLAKGAGGEWDKWQRLYNIAWEDALPLGFKYRLSLSRFENRTWENYVVHPASPRTDPPEGVRSLQGNETDPETDHLAEARLYHTHESRAWASRALLGFTFLHQRFPNQYATIGGVTADLGPPNLDMAAATFQSYAGFAQEDLSFWKWLNLSGGVRVEYRERHGFVAKEDGTREEDERSNLVATGQGALMLTSPMFHGKLVYAEGFRPPGANSLYSEVGTTGNRYLQPERSRALTLEAGMRLGAFRFRLGGTAAWLSELIYVRPEGGPNPLKPDNGGTTRITSGYGEVGVEWSPVLSGFLNYSYKQLWESNPVGKGVPVAPHTASLGVSIRPTNDLSVYATASLISPRTLTLVTPSGDVSYDVGTTADLSIGAWLTNLFDRLDLGLKLHNPVGLSHDSPYWVDGNRNWLVEHRQVTELLLTLRFSSAVELAEAGNSPPRPPTMPPSAAPASQPGGL